MKHKRNFSRLYLALTILLFGSMNVQGAHIVGGEVYYTFVSFNADTTEVTFRIEIPMYRDAFSGGAQFDRPPDGAMFGIYRQRTPLDWFFIDRVGPIDHGPVSDVVQADDPCVEEPSNVGVQTAVYSFQYTFEIIDESYMITYQRCCRNETITNIRDPGDTGAVFDIEITPEAQRLGNSSPQFNEFPPIFICQGADIGFDHSAIDRDGDVLRYTFCAPFESGGTVDANTGNLGCCECVRPNPVDCPPNYGNVTFLPPYTAQAPMAGNPLVTIDQVSGLISGVPELLGQFVVGVCVEEFRNGVRIGTIRRDFQFNVVPCVPNVVADFAYEILDTIAPIAGDCKKFEINSCGENTIRILNDSQQESNIFEYHWTFFNPDGSVLNDVVGGANVRDVDVTFPDIGEYTGQMIINEGSDCSDTACFFINIYPSIDADFSFEYDTCSAGEVSFFDQSITGAAGGITAWQWNFLDGNTSNQQDPMHEFDRPGILPVNLTVTDDNRCSDEVVLNVDWRPVPNLIIVEPSTFVGCSPSEIFFNNLSSPIDSTYEILWDFGDGNTSDQISPTHVFNDPGNYSISLTIKSPVGCETSENFQSWIRVLEGPEADFAFSPEQPNIFNNTVSFTNLSLRDGAWQWNFGGIGSSSDENPTYTFQDTGVYEVKLTVFHERTNCTDTISQIIDVEPIVKFFMPNAFTPNNDTSNDLFLGNGFYDGLADFTMSIWNRWGELVFETTDPRDGWNGQKNNSGNFSPQGVYVYKVSYIGPRGDRENLEGHVTLIR